MAATRGGASATHRAPEFFPSRANRVLSFAAGGLRLAVCYLTSWKGKF
uniref:Uncharacterized protein n=1 Tax=Arundo donax TaxID=35708 RepID=A0A0A9CF21_ARUDO